ncbi:hypothetical protein [Tessaracoccus massiliensis]|uniref:hypothetical protein n=1 Tax=Tessaracoccus massiliensis TaxID=1522311 RepID=UPI0011193CB7|nr:hypothetical protein [Tessaracoccus massiliensis]
MPFIAQGVAFVVALVTNLAISGDHRPQRNQAASAWGDFAAGLSFCRKAPLLVWACGAFMLLNLAGNGLLATVIMILQLAGHRPEVIGLVRGPAIGGWGIALVGDRWTLGIFAGIALAAVIVAVAQRGLRELPPADRWAEVTLD